MSLAAAGAGAVSFAMLATKLVTGEDTNPPYFVFLAAAPLALLAGLSAFAADSSSWLARAALGLGLGLALLLALTTAGTA